MFKYGKNNIKIKKDKTRLVIKVSKNYRFEASKNTIFSINLSMRT